jgi:hypothetical protein
MAVISDLMLPSRRVNILLTVSARVGSSNTLYSARWKLSMRRDEQAEVARRLDAEAQVELEVAELVHQLLQVLAALHARHLRLPVISEPAHVLVCLGPDVTESGRGADRLDGREEDAVLDVGLVAVHQADVGRDGPQCPLLLVESRRPLDLHELLPVWRVEPVQDACELVLVGGRVTVLRMREHHLMALGRQPVDPVIAEHGPGAPGEHCDVVGERSAGDRDVGGSAPLEHVHSGRRIAAEIRAPDLQRQCRHDLAERESEDPRLGGRDLDVGRGLREHDGLPAVLLVVEDPRKLVAVQRVELAQPSQLDLRLGVPGVALVPPLGRVHADDAHHLIAGDARHHRPPARVPGANRPH